MKKAMHKAMHKAQRKRSTNSAMGVLMGALLFFCLCSKPVFALTPGLELFEEPVDVQIALDSLETPYVIRERPVYFRYDAFHDDAETLILNLFDDVEFIAVRDYVEENSSGGFAWMGYLEGVEASDVTLVTDGVQLSGTISLSHVEYHVRPVMDDLHVVRELALAPQADEQVGALAQGNASDELAGGFTYQLAPNYNLSLEEEAVLDLVNQERGIMGLTPLASDSRLVAAARDHSVDMSANNYFSHYSLDGRSPADRISDAGYPWSTYGENVAVGYSTPQAVMNGWMSSAGHRANILSSAFCDIGVGYAASGRYWTQDFGRQGGVVACSGGSGGSGGGSGGSGGGSGQSAVLANGVSENFSVSGGQIKQFTIDLPANVTTLTVGITGSGDADIYVKRTPINWSADQGYHNQADFKAPFANGSNEMVQFNSPASGTWYVLVHGYRAASGQIEAQWQQGGGSGGGSGQSGGLANGVGENFSLAGGQIKQFTIDLPANATTLTVGITGSGDADIYVKRTPINWSADQGYHNQSDFKAPFANGSNELVRFNSPAGGTWHVLVHGYRAASGVIQGTWY